MYLIDIFRVFPLRAAEYTFFSSAHGTFSRVNHMLDHKVSFNKLKKTKIASSIFSDYNTMRLEINYRSSRCGTVETNPTRNHEAAGLILGLTQWVEDPALP